MQGRPCVRWQHHQAPGDEQQLARRRRSRVRSRARPAGQLGRCCTTSGTANLCSIAPCLLFGYVNGELLSPSKRKACQQVMLPSCMAMMAAVGNTIFMLIFMLLEQRHSWSLL